MVPPLSVIRSPTTMQRARYRRVHPDSGGTLLIGEVPALHVLKNQLTDNLSPPHPPGLQSDTFKLAFRVPFGCLIPYFDHSELRHQGIELVVPHRLHLVSDLRVLPSKDQHHECRCKANISGLHFCRAAAIQSLAPEYRHQTDVWLTTQP